MEVYKQCICFHQSWLWPAYKGRWTSQIPRPVQCLVGSHQSRTPWKSYCHCLFHKHLCWNLWSREILQHCLLDQVQHSCLESWIKGLMLVEILKPKLTHKILNKILKTEVTHKGNKLTVCNHGSQLFSWHSFHGDIIKLLSSWKIMRRKDSVIEIFRILRKPQRFVMLGPLEEPDATSALKSAPDERWVKSDL